MDSPNIPTSEDVPASRPLLLGLALLVAVIVIQIGWHWLIGLNNVISELVRELYLERPESGMRHHALVEVLADGLVPAFVTGAVYGRWSASKTPVSIIVFSIALGITLAVLQLTYPGWVTYEMWWIETYSSMRELAIKEAATIFVISVAPALSYYDAQRSKRLTENASI